MIIASKMQQEGKRERERYKIYEDYERLIM